MATITDLLALHDGSTSPASLRDSLGDGWLLANNPLYRRIRAQTVDLDWRFASRGGLVDAYVADALLCLEDILDGHVLPYIDNVTALRSFAARAPSVPFRGEFFSASLRPNLLLHESAHVIAHVTIFGRSRTLRGHAAADPRRFVLGMALAEAFANAVEDAVALSTSPGAGALFFKLNSHFALELPAREIRAALTDACSAADVFRGSIGAYLLANLRPVLRATSPRDRRTIARTMGLDAGRLEARMTAFCDRALTLSPTFRGLVAEAHQRYMGIDDPADILRELELESVLADPAVLAMIDRLTGQLVGDVTRGDDR